jgi:hypothetical protein
MQKKNPRKKEEKKVFRNAFHGREQLCFTIATSPRRASICIAANCVRHRQGLEAAKRRKTTDNERTDSFVEHGSCVRSLDGLIFNLHPKRLCWPFQ